MLCHSRIHTEDEADKRLTEIFGWIPRAPLALPKRVSAFFVLQKLLHFERQMSGGLGSSLKSNVSL